MTEISKMNQTNDTNALIAPQLQPSHRPDVHRDDLVNTLSNALVSDFPFSGKAIVLDSKLEPKKAIEILLKHKMRAAPVLDGAENRFIGVLDLRDTVKYALQCYHSLKEQLSTPLKATHEVLTSTSTVPDLCRHRPFRYVTESDSLLSVAKLFADGYHVVGVINFQSNKKRLIGLITQGYFFHEIAKKWVFNDEAHDCLLQVLFDLKYITSPIKSMHKSVVAHSAFQTMVDKDLSGLAVCDNDGVIVHNISATDIKLWLLSCSMLDASIEQFLVSIRNLSLIERYPVCACHLTDTLKRAIQMLVATKYHRIWIVNENRHPIGVLSITDIFRFICKLKENTLLA